MTRRDSFRGEYGDDEPETEWSEAEKHPGRGIFLVLAVMFLLAIGFIIGGMVTR